jgi:hypothetical protein
LSNMRRAQVGFYNRVKIVGMAKAEAVLAVQVYSSNTRPH